LANSIELKTSFLKNNHRHNSAHSRKSRIKSGQKKYNSGINSGKRYNSVNVSDNLGRGGHYNSYGSMSKDRKKSKNNGFVATQQRIKDLLDKNSRSKSNYRSGGRDLSSYQ